MDVAYDPRLGRFGGLSLSDQPKHEKKYGFYPTKLHIISSQDFFSYIQNFQQHHELPRRRFDRDIKDDPPHSKAYVTKQSNFSTRVPHSTS